MTTHAAAVPIATLLSALLLTTTAFAEPKPPAALTRSFVPLASFGCAARGLSAAPLRLDCEDRASADAAPGLLTNGRASPAVGIEFGAVNLGQFQRDGGDLRAQGLDLRVIANLLLTPTIDAYAKVGGMTQWTQVEGGQTPGIDEQTLDLSVGAGLQYHLSPMWSLSADWDQYPMRSAQQRERVSLYSVGTRYRF